VEIYFEKETVMGHQEDEEEQEPKYWTPEEEAENATQARLNKVLDKADKQLEAFAKEARSPAPEPFSDIALNPVRHAQIEIRVIGNGFVMSYSYAKLDRSAGMKFPVYRPVPEEIYISGPAAAAAPVTMALENALLLTETLRKLDEFFDPPPPEAPH
jgi:hypothetical protein